MKLVILGIISLRNNLTHPFDMFSEFQTETLLAVHSSLDEHLS